MRRRSMPIYSVRTHFLRHWRRGRGAFHTSHSLRHKVSNSPVGKIGLDLQGSGGLLERVEQTAVGLQERVEKASNVETSEDHHRLPLRATPAAESRHSLPDALWLRDACSCLRCVDQSTKQKLFQTSDIPLDIKAQIIEETATTVRIAWETDVPTYGPEHMSTYKKGVLRTITSVKDSGSRTADLEPQTWNKLEMERKIDFVDFADYQTSNSTVFNVLKQLKIRGLVFIRNVPPAPSTIESIANRIGHLRSTFYGHTWDVKSVPRAQNVAYTSQNLGFHMDLLYMQEPPAFQLLHCLRNSCPGGSSMFSDGLQAGETIKQTNEECYKVLTTYPQTFHYHNANQHYRITNRPVISHNPITGKIKHINWSPPFQAPFPPPTTTTPFAHYVQAAHAFAAHVEAPESIYEYRMQVGDCVIFDNRRVLHARRAFDTRSGERWLKGGYLDRDVFESRWRVLGEEMQEGGKGREIRDGDSG